MNIRYYIKNPRKLILLLNRKRLLNFLPDKAVLKIVYRATFGKKLDLKNPQTYNEKLQWIKLFDRNPLYTALVDKYLVRGFVKEQIGEEYLIPLLGEWKKAEEIDLDQLPDRFVLKCNHDSGSVVICKDKTHFNLTAIQKKLNHCMRRGTYMYGREWPYKNVEPRIIAEQYMEDEQDKGTLSDYKIHCFNGEPRFILVCSDRYSPEGLHEDFYDLEWNLMDMRRPSHPNSSNGIPKPDKLEEMLGLARKLSKDLPFSRIDFYVINSKIYFGEITLFPASGFRAFEPEKWDAILGEWIELPAKTI